MTDRDPSRAVVRVTLPALVEPREYVSFSRFCASCHACVHVLSDRAASRCAYWHTSAGYPTDVFTVWRNGGGTDPSGETHEPRQECPRFEHMERRAPLLVRLARGLGLR